MPSPSDNQQKRRVILGVTGGIAVYKSCELVRLLRKASYETRVVMTKQAEAFVGPLTFASLSVNPVLRSLGAEDYDFSATSHIDLAQWGDIFVVAPATANFLAKFSQGICDDALNTEALAFTGPILVAPAMNLRMWEAKVTQENCERLRARSIHFVGPVVGDLACGEIGLGKMSEPAEIFAEIERIASEQKLFIGKKVLVTSGPTRSYIDSVRFLTNRSSGKMGHALALAAEQMGAEVVLVSGPVEDRYARLARGKVLRVETGQEMRQIVEREFPQADLVIGAAAVADFESKAVAPGKLERREGLELKLHPAKDILGTMARARRPGQVILGFAAESGLDETQRIERAQRKLAEKQLDFIAMNDVGRTDIGFDVDTNELHILASGDPPEHIFLERAEKSLIARRLLAIVSRKFPAPKDI